jgi:hypothetical protein
MCANCLPREKEQYEVNIRDSLFYLSVKRTEIFVNWCMVSFSDLQLKTSNGYWDLMDPICV